MTTETSNGQSPPVAEPDLARLRDTGRIKQRIMGDVLPETQLEPAQSEIDISVVCPFYNEGQIVETAIRTLLERLETHLNGKWELIVVNDGSLDDSGEVAAKVAAEHSRLRYISYRHNRGRGHALRTGIHQARGDIIVTTEIDLSWGEDIVERLVAAMQDNPDADIVVASPHLPGGGYKNVPPKRVFLSKFGNHVIRALMTDAVTMNTGMTRAYRREAIQALPLDEDRKEFHLEVILKAQALGYRIAEIPSILEWKQYKHQGQRVKRKSSSKVNKLMVTHSLFSLFAQPIRYLWPLAIVSGLLSAGFMAAGVVFLFTPDIPSAFVVIVSLTLAIIAMILFIFGVLTQQGNMLQTEIWRLREELQQLKKDEDKDQS